MTNAFTWAVLACFVAQNFAFYCIQCRLVFYPGPYCLAGCWFCCSYFNGHFNGKTAVGKHFRGNELISREIVPHRKWYELLPQRTLLAFSCLLRGHIYLEDVQTPTLKHDKNDGAILYICEAIYILNSWKHNCSRYI